MSARGGRGAGHSTSKRPRSVGRSGRRIRTSSFVTLADDDRAPRRRNADAGNRSHARKSGRRAGRFQRPRLCHNVRLHIAPFISLPFPSGGFDGPRTRIQASITLLVHMANFFGSLDLELRLRTCILPWTLHMDPFMLITKYR